MLGANLVGEITALKQERNGLALIFGSASAVHALPARGLIDGYNLVIDPIVLGRGTRLFAEGAPAKMTLIENVSHGGGIVSLRYAINNSPTFSDPNIPTTGHPARTTANDETGWIVVA